MQLSLAKRKTGAHLMGEADGMVLLIGLTQAKETFRYPEQKLTRVEALRGFTIDRKQLAPPQARN